MDLLDVVVWASRPMPGTCCAYDLMWRLWTQGGHAHDHGQVARARTWTAIHVDCRTKLSLANLLPSADV